MGLARELGLRGSVLTDIYYVSLLRFIGCTADSHETAALAGGDDIAFRSEVAVHTMGDLAALRAFLLERGSRAGMVGAGPGRQLSLAAVAKASAQALNAHCEVAERLADKLGFGESVRTALSHAFERWDGSGAPAGLAGLAIPQAVRIAIVARDVEIVSRRLGVDAAVKLVQTRRGSAYDPQLCAVIEHSAGALLQMIDNTPLWETVLAEEPQPQRRLDGDGLDAALAAFAVFVDLKTPLASGHSSQVAALAAAAGQQLGLSAGEVLALRRAGWVHDLGHTGVANSIWEKPGPLTALEREHVRQHPYLTQRILARCSGLEQLAALAGAHHERLDGSGYHVGSSAGAQPLAQRVLAVADAYQAMTQTRAHRPARSPDRAARELRADCGDNTLDRRAVDALIAVATDSSLRRRPASDILTAREIEVLRLLCRGQSNREMAARLDISSKTIGHHVQHIYQKLGVSTRAGATLCAMQQGMLDC